MDWKKIAPWNWFKEEEDRGSGRPVRAGTPSDPLGMLRSEMERLFDETFSSHFPAATSSPVMRLRPDVDISEGRKAYTVRAEMPGVELDDVSIEVEGRTLAIRAEKRRESEEEPLAPSLRARLGDREPRDDEAPEAAPRRAASRAAESSADRSAPGEPDPRGGRVDIRV